MEASHHDLSAVPRDTSADAHARQREVYLRLGGKARVAIMFQLTETVRGLTMAGIRARHPDYDEAQVRLAYRRLVLGDQLLQAAWPGCQLVDP